MIRRIYLAVTEMELGPIPYYSTYRENTRVCFGGFHGFDSKFRLTEVQLSFLLPSGKPRRAALSPPALSHPATAAIVENSTAHSSAQSQPKLERECCSSIPRSNISGIVHHGPGRVQVPSCVVREVFQEETGIRDSSPST